MDEQTAPSARVRWATLRLSIIGTLLSSPPEPGELGAGMRALAARTWRHPTNGESVRFSAKTIERWYYEARDHPEPIVVLERKVHQHAGTHPSVSEPVAEVIRTLRRDHPRWSYQLVHDNMCAVAREKPELGRLPGVLDGVPLHAQPRSREGAQATAPRARARLRAARASALRGEARARAVARRLPRGQAQGRDRERKPRAREPLRAARRSVEALLPRPVVRRHREHGELHPLHLSGASRSAVSLAPCLPTTARRCWPPRPSKDCVDSPSRRTRRSRRLPSRMASRRSSGLRSRVV